MNELSEQIFRCLNDNCEKISLYSEAISHLKECDMLMKPCTEGCGLGLLGKDMEYHIKRQCKNLKETCPYCEEDFFPRQITEPHDCVKLLKANLKEARNKIKELEKNQQSVSMARV